MFSFSKEQKVSDISGTKIGGQPGQFSTALICSIFYEGDKLVEDGEKGIFKEKEAKKQIERLENLAEDYGNSLVLDVVGGEPEALINYIDFVAEEADLPFLIDGTNPDVRIPATKHVGDIGIEERAIYNTIGPEYKEKEIDAIKKAGIKSAVLLCYNPQKFTIDGRIEVLEELLEVVDGTGIEDLLVDPSTLDIPEPGLIAKTQFRVKEEFGLPTGSGVHNAVDQWKERVGIEREKHKMASILANSLPIALGGDFTLSGPYTNAEDMFFSTSLVDAYIAYSMRLENNIQPESKDHPFYKVFRK